MSGKICEIVRGYKTFCFPSERLSEWVTDPTSNICDVDLASTIDFMPPPTRTQAAITKIIGISLNISTPIIINH